MTASSYTDTFARDHLPPQDAWPELVFELPELKYPDRINAAVELLDRMLDRGFGDKRALVGSSETLTYRELQQRVNQIAHFLREDLQLPTGSRVLLRGANSPMLAACFLAVLKAGLIAVPTMPLLRAKELATIMRKAEVNAVLCAQALRAEVDTAKAQLDESFAIPCAVVGFGTSEPAGLEQRIARKPADFVAHDSLAEDVCLIGFTSGTTGVPKGTMHFHRDVLAICDCFPRSTLKSCSDDIFIGTPPLAFTFGLGGLLLFPMRVGATAVLLEKLTPETLLAAIEQHRATVCFTAPTSYRAMAAMAARFKLDSLTRTVSAGEALSSATRALWKDATGLDMIDGIGATEMLHIFISAAGQDVRAGATGKPIPGYMACILDADGQRVGPGVVGRLAIKGPTGCRYLADERQRDYVQGGWNLTGDAYEMDADGYFWYRARTDDMIISAGYNIAGPEVEEALLKHPAVAECAVVGWPDEERGQIVKAFVVVKPDQIADAALTVQLQEWVKQSIAPYKYPRAIEYLPNLPRTETGKLQRFKLRKTGA